MSSVSGNSIVSVTIPINIKHSTRTIILLIKKNCMMIATRNPVGLFVLNGNLAVLNERRKSVLLNKIMNSLEKSWLAISVGNFCQFTPNYKPIYISIYFNYLPNRIYEFEWIVSQIGGEVSGKANHHRWQCAKGCGHICTCHMHSFHP